MQFLKELLRKKEKIVDNKVMQEVDGKLNNKMQVGSIPKVVDAK